MMLTGLRIVFLVSLLGAVVWLWYLGWVSRHDG